MNAIARRSLQSRLSVRLRDRSGVALLALTLAAACRVDRPTGVPPIAGLGLAKGGGGAPPTVTSTSPSQAPQDTTLDVNVYGSGFAPGAKAFWSLAGDTTKVHVLSTKVVSSSQLVARIQVPSTAPVATYDVEVVLRDGKKGVGAEMFEVLEGDPTTTLLLPTDDASLGVQSDGAYVSGGFSAYADGTCGVRAKIFATEVLSNSGDATMQTSNPRYKDRRCAVYPRMFVVNYGDGVILRSAVAVNVNRIANTTYQIPVGTTVRRAMNINDARCDGLTWRAQLPDGRFTGADSVNVTRVDASTWLVESQPWPNNRAFCQKTGGWFHIAVRFTIVASRPLP